MRQSNVFGVRIQINDTCNVLIIIDRQIKEQGSMWKLFMMDGIYWELKSVNQERNALEVAQKYLRNNIILIIIVNTIVVVTTEHAHANSRMFLYKIFVFVLVA